MHAGIPAKNWKCSILHQKWKCFSTSQTFGPWTLLRKLPAKIVANFSVMKVVSRNTSDNTTRKTSLIATYVRGNSIQSSCWRTTLENVIQMWTVTFVIRICWKVHSIVTNKRTRRIHSNVKCVIKFTQGKTTWRSTWRLAGQILCESEKKQQTLEEFDCKFCEKVYASNQKLGKHVSC